MVLHGWFAVNNDNCKPEEGDPITEGHCGLADPGKSVLAEIIDCQLTA